MNPSGGRTRFSLSGPSRPFDPARNAIRPDIADFAEAEHHFAPHYAVPANWVATTDTQLTQNADPQSDVRAPMAAGAPFALIDLTGDWAWGYRVDGHIVGYVPAAHVAPADDAS
ncbi:MAG: SH3 domain-containing protein [Sphingopyxis sp.]